MHTIRLVLQMASLLTLTYSQPTRTLAAGEVLISEGQKGGDLFVLESGRLSVERGGVAIATVTEPGSLIGEMSILMDRPYSATVRAERESQVRVVHDAIRYLERQPAVALHVASVLSHRLDATSALVVDLTRNSQPNAEQKGLLDRIFTTIMTPLASRRDTRAHE